MSDENELEKINEKKAQQFAKCLFEKGVISNIEPDYYNYEEDRFYVVWHIDEIVNLRYYGGRGKPKGEYVEICYTGDDPDFFEEVEDRFNLHLKFSVTGNANQHIDVLNKNIPIIIDNGKLASDYVDGIYWIKYRNDKINTDYDFLDCFFEKRHGHIVEFQVKKFEEYCKEKLDSKVKKLIGYE